MFHSNNSISHKNHIQRLIFEQQLHLYYRWVLFKYEPLKLKSLEMVTIHVRPKYRSEKHTLRKPRLSLIMGMFTERRPKETYAYVMLMIPYSTLLIQRKLCPAKSEKIKLCMRCVMASLKQRIVHKTKPWKIISKSCSNSKLYVMSSYVIIRY